MASSRDSFSYPGLLTNRKVREYLSHFSEGQWDQVVKMTLIYGIQSLLLNEITQANFSEFWDKTSVLFKPNVKNNQSLKDQLFDFIRMKDIVAEYIWYMLVGFLVTSVSYNYVVNTLSDTKHCSNDAPMNIKMQSRLSYETPFLRYD